MNTFGKRGEFGVPGKKIQVVIIDYKPIKISGFSNVFDSTGSFWRGDYLARRTESGSMRCAGYICGSQKVLPNLGQSPTI